MGLVAGCGVVSLRDCSRHTITNAGTDRVRLLAMDKGKPNADQLQQSLSRLHQALARTPQVEESSKKLLREVLDDIERLLGSGAGPAAAARAPSQSNLEALAVRFEVDHPALSGSLREFIELLRGAGV
jgi:hypothetical protein